jgi:hypothetical protein
MEQYWRTTLIFLKAKNNEFSSACSKKIPEDDHQRAWSVKFFKRQYVAEKILHSM